MSGGTSEEEDVPWRGSSGSALIMVQRSGGLISPTTDGGKSMQKTGNRDSSLISVCLWQNKIGGFWMQGSKKKVVISQRGKAGGDCSADRIRRPKVESRSR